MTGQDFTGPEFEFAMGSLFGLRAWKVDPQGRLFGVTQPVVWTPGENVSVCMKPLQIVTGYCPKFEHAQGINRAREKTGGSPIDPTAHGRCSQTCDREYHFRVTEVHEFATDCDCGFWAYDEEGFSVYSGAHVVGVIEAYGKTTVGEKGFRAHKARIVALAAYGPNGVLSAGMQRRLMDLYRVEMMPTLNELIEAFPGVRRQWEDATAEDFWTRPVPVKESGGWSFNPSSNSFVASSVVNIPTSGGGGVQFTP